MQDKNQKWVASGKRVQEMWHPNNEKKETFSPIKSVKKVQNAGFDREGCKKPQNVKIILSDFLCKKPVLQFQTEKLQKSVDSGYFLWYHKYNSFVKKQFFTKYRQPNPEIRAQRAQEDGGVRVSASGEQEILRNFSGLEGILFHVNNL